MRCVRFILFILSFAALTGAGAVPAHADLTITPVRVVFQGRDRSATVELLNLTNKTNTYRLKWLKMTMNEGGRYQLVKEDPNDPYSFDKMVIFTPRQVTIPPHGHQTVRLSLRRPADLPNGEYIAHLAMVRLAREGPERPDPKAKGIEMELNVNLGFSIPVIVRSGTDDNLRVSLVQPRLFLQKGNKTPTPMLGIDVHRDSGKFSTYGTIKVFWTPSGGEEHEIGATNNVALYPNMNIRKLSIPLRANPNSGKLRVVYTGKYESEGTTWAEKTFPIGK